LAKEIPGIERFNLDSRAKVVSYDVKTLHSESGYLGTKSQILKELELYLGGSAE